MLFIFYLIVLNDNETKLRASIFLIVQMNVGDLDNKAKLRKDVLNYLPRMESECERLEFTKNFSN